MSLKYFQPEVLTTSHHLRVLASGANQTTVVHSFCLAKSTVNNIFRETVTAIWDTMQPTFLPEPNVNRWKENAEAFERLWNFPNCVGAIDGKHVLSMVNFCTNRVANVLKAMLFLETR